MEPDLKEEDKLLMKIYEWIDTIPLSRDKKNIARDFSDGMLLAEIIKHYYPKLIEIHNYPSASSTKQKLSNWNTMSIKAFKKMNLVVKQSEIKDIIASKPKAIEKLLIQIYSIVTKQPVTTTQSEGRIKSPDAPSITKKTKEYARIKDIEQEIKAKEEEFAQLTQRRQDIEKQLTINDNISETLQQKIKKLSKTLQVE